MTVANQPESIRRRRPDCQVKYQILQRVFSVDVLTCPRCGERSEIIATICDGRAIAAFLKVWQPSREPP